MVRDRQSRYMYQGPEAIKLGICVKSLPSISMTASGSGKPHSPVVEADTSTQPVSQGSSCHELSSDPLTSGPDS